MIGNVSGSVARLNYIPTKPPSGLGRTIEISLYNLVPPRIFMSSLEQNLRRWGCDWPHTNISTIWAWHFTTAGQRSASIPQIISFFDLEMIVLGKYKNKQTKNIWDGISGVILSLNGGEGRGRLARYRCPRWQHSSPVRSQWWQHSSANTKSYIIRCHNVNCLHPDNCPSQPVDPINGAKLLDDDNECGVRSPRSGDIRARLGGTRHCQSWP